MSFSYLIFELVIGLIVVLLGVLIWKKQMIKLIHSYHYGRVSEENKKVYTRKMGQICILMGFGPILDSVIRYLTMTSYSGIIFFVFFIPSMILFYRTQKKYNGGIFS